MRLSHINVLELKAVLFGLKALCEKFKDTHIKVLTDNTTAVHTINKMGSCRSKPCDQIVRQIWDWAIKRNNWITASHIPGVLNIEADEESRKCELRSEWQLNKNIFQTVIQHFKVFPDLDLFATRINTQLPSFFSYRPDPDAMAVNAFSVDWEFINFYCFPPFSCIGKVIQKIITDNASGILIVPNWPN